MIRRLIGDSVNRIRGSKNKRSRRKKKKRRMEWSRVGKSNSVIMAQEEGH